MKREWETELQRLGETMVPLKRRPALQEASRLVPSIVNVVATATFLPGGYTLPMKAIARTLGCTQYAPRMFAANILKLTDSISACTALIFSTGCVVVVSLRSENHARYICQMLRVLLETVRCVLKERDGTWLGARTLEGRLDFDRCEIHNIVGKAALPFRIDLQRMAEAAPSSCKWFKDSFPGLECKVWLTPSYSCVCGRPPGYKAPPPAAVFEGPGQRKCSCAVKLLIFPTGQLVITGARRLQDVNAVFFRVKALAPLYEEAAATKDAGPPPAEFYQDFAQKVGAAPQQQPAVVGVRTQKELKADVAIACIMANVSMLAPAVSQPAAGIEAGERMPPFMQMALAGRVEVVRGLFLMDPDAATECDAQGRTTLERLQAIAQVDLTPEQKQIMDMLQ